MAFDDKLRGVVSITRPHLALMTFTLATAVALLATYDQGLTGPNIWEFIAVVTGTYLAVVGSYVFNDFCDVDIDEIAFPQRAIPSSSMSRKEALALAVALYAGSLALFAILEPLAMVLVMVAIALVTVYSRYLKRTTPYSFLAVGVAYGLVPLGVWLAMTRGISIVTLQFCLMICITDWGFTNCDASRDVEADRSRGVPTFPVTYGISATSKLVILCWSIGITLSLGIWFSAILSPLFLLAAVVAGGWIFWRCLRFIKNPRPDVGDELFLDGSRYRGILFGFMILDLILFLSGYGLLEHTL